MDLAVDDGLVIHGDPLGRLVTVLDPSGQTLGLLPHWVKHSPDGFAWGYAGSGPAELARSVLIAVLGEHARCVTCAGTGRIAYDETTGAPAPPDPDQPDQICARCLDCDTGFALPGSLYQQFKFEVIAAFPREQGWQLSVTAIRSWSEGSVPLGKWPFMVAQEGEHAPTARRSQHLP